MKAVYFSCFCFGLFVGAILTGIAILMADEYR